MKKLIIILAVVLSDFMITTAFNSIDNSAPYGDFCDGWDDGYQEALEGCYRVGVTPICPIAPIGKNTYKHGYGLGYAKGMKKCDE